MRMGWGKRENQKPNSMLTFSMIAMDRVHSLSNTDTITRLHSSSSMFRSSTTLSVSPVGYLFKRELVASPSSVWLVFVLRLLLLLLTIPGNSLGSPSSVTLLIERFRSVSGSSAGYWPLASPGCCTEDMALGPVVILVLCCGRSALLPS